MQNALQNASGKDKIELLNKISSSYFGTSPEKSIEYASQALELAKNTGDYENQCRSLRNIGIGYSYLSQYDKALKYFEESLVIAKDNDLKSQLSLSYNSLGNYHYLTGTLEKALDYYLLAYQIGKETDNKGGLISYLGNIGIIYSNLGNYEKALEYYFKSLDLAEEINDRKGVGRAYVNIGAVYTDSKNNKKALEYYFKAVKITTETNDLYTKANTLNNIGNIYASEDKLDKALEVYQESIKIKEEIGDEFGIAVSLGDIGSVYSQKGDNKSALEYQEKSYEMHKKIGNPEGEIITLISIGKTYINTGQYGNAVNSFRKAVELSRTYNAKLLMDSFEGMAQAYEKMGSYQNAFNTFKQYERLKDSLFNETSSKQIAELQTKYESERKDKEISLLQRDKKISELTIQGQNFLRNTLIASIAVLLIIGALVLNRYRLKNKTNKMLEEKVEQINLQKEELKVLNANKDKLLSIISHDLRSPFQALVGYSELLAVSLDDLSKNEIEDYANDINATAHQTLELLENLLEWSRMQLGKITFKPERFNITPVINKATRFMLPGASRKDLMIKAEIEEDYTVYADEQMITSVLQNLLSNAIKFSHKGGVISVIVKGDTKYAGISVEDEGTGISSENLSKVFNSDVHFSTKGTAEEKGSGLGLELCKELVEKNGGTIRVESEEGKGSRFIFTVPLGLKIS